MKLNNWEKRGVYSCCKCRASITKIVWERCMQDATNEERAYCVPCQTQDKRIAA
jgi:hypothetical protein